MTNQELDRGKQIEGELLILKGSLSEAMKAKLFSIDEGGSYQYGRQACPFLAELEIKTRAFAATEINARISELNKEFNAL
jgi:hypothetical protein